VLGRPKRATPDLDPAGRKPRKLIFLQCTRTGKMGVDWVPFLKSKGITFRPKSSFTFSKKPSPR